MTNGQRTIGIQGSVLIVSFTNKSVPLFVTVSLGLPAGILRVPPEHRFEFVETDRVLTRVTGGLARDPPQDPPR